ncbi:hypothetical protein [Agrococcus sp. BE272]|uniref:hypothetical protein n=1 Tax=Agrococcus sp. BE272 TaxID=2817727 RepID=UPI00285C735E|nr:hypothetical protein [Agrococcus sp. BE272]MDR7233993.1 hypothetical protein [Agrococcus sp. BE272]
MTTTGPEDPARRGEPYPSDADRRAAGHPTDRPLDPTDDRDRRIAAEHDERTRELPRHDRDLDRDGVPDERERRHGLADRDGDGVADVRERRHDLADRDGDGVADVRERRVVDEPLGVDPRHDREVVVARERERFGGVKVGSAFFGWLTATGAVVLLTALAAAIVALVASLSGGVDDVVEDAQQNLDTTGIWGIVILLAIWFVGYYCGGYVAGRMARFDGAKQGVAVWVWAVVIAILAAIVGLVAGQNFAVPPGSMPTLPLPEDQATTATIISALVVAVVALIGAVLGGLAGMRFHRRVDRAGFEVGSTARR